MKDKTTTSSFGVQGRIAHDASKFYASKLYQNLEKKHTEHENVENEVPKEFLNSIINSSSENMKELPSSSCHLMITSPPYNVSKEYDEDLSLNEYLSLLKNVFLEVYRVLINGGRACVNVANIGRKPYIPLADYISTMMIDMGFNMRGEIIWDKGASAAPSTAWGSWQSASNPISRDVHEYILIFSKGEYGRDRGKKENTISKEDFIEWSHYIWHFNAESAKRIGQPAPFLIELPHRLIGLYSFKSDVVLDPFVGSGSTAIAAIKNARHYVGYEIRADYVSLAQKRIKEMQGELFM